MLKFMCFHALIVILSVGTANAKTSEETPSDSTLEKSFADLKALCERDDFEACNRMPEPAARISSLARKKRLISEAVSTTRRACEKHGVKEQNGMFCDVYANLLESVRLRETALVIRLQLCAENIESLSCSSAVRELNDQKKYDRAYSLARKMCEHKSSECSTFIRLLPNSPDHSYFVQQSDKVCLTPTLRSYGDYACRDLGSYRLSQGSADEALKLYSTACARGSPTNCELEAAMHLKKNDLKSAKSALRKACADLNETAAGDSQTGFFNTVCAAESTDTDFDDKIKARVRESLSLSLADSHIW